MSLPPLPWTAKGSRIYAADGEEIAVATKASPKYRANAEVTAAAIVLRMNGTASSGFVRVKGGYLAGKLLPILGPGRTPGYITSRDHDGYYVVLGPDEYDRVTEPDPNA